MSDPEVIDVSDMIGGLYDDVGLRDGEPSAKRPNKRGEQTRERIVTAAIECFTEYGYTRTRVSDIVHRAGTAQGNFYRHFTSLDDVFLAALRPGLEALAVVPTRRTGHSFELESLVESNTSYLHSYARYRHTLRLLREAAAASANDGFLQLWLRLRGDFVARTRRWLQRLTDNGHLRAGEDLDLLAEALGCLTEQLAYVHVGLPASTPRRERIDELGRSLGESWYRLLPRAEEDR
ncbi:AcrR family transcriptional regulator [Nocardioides zeae]|uniref:AcrR family transcriptional regulator n=2 Tax=Nocardioides zeae TaxID=1457234 RepID=A0AAJ1U7E3_9ACTN|nr:TetR/AcrR family transcriptional regulator [Nocardioides zeae]MDQ1105866.1 AcrR family transcriptional regulator [Nocardioides zeae]MDR6174488.1 AcrR family transcriptional regulator [Nocardioides zeae]MDR6210560.1 AcrR family transcriptional regulator [Nocardioides zeae]